MDDFVLTVKQIFNYPQKSAAQGSDALLIQSGGLGGAYNYVWAKDLIGTALNQGGYINLAPNGIGGIAFNGASLTFSSDQFAFTEELKAPQFFVDDPRGIPYAGPVATIDYADFLFANSVHSFNGRVGPVLLELPDIMRAGGAPILNPHLLGWCTATSPLPPELDDDTIATCRWVHDAVWRDLLCRGVVLSFDGRGGCVWLNDADITLACTATGAEPRSNSPPAGDASSRIATTFFVDDGLGDLRSYVDSSILGAVTATFPRGYLAGCLISNNATTPLTVLDIAAGVAASDDNTTLLRAAALSKTVSGLWAAGSNQPGLDAGTVAASTWYHVFVIANAATGVTDVLFSLSATAPALPAGYSAKRRIGAFRTDASLHILAFAQNGDEFLWAAPSADVAVTNLGTAATLFTLNGVPAAIVVNALIRATVSNAAANTDVLLSSPVVSDQAPSAATGLSSLRNPLAAGLNAGGPFSVRTNTAQQIRGRAGAASTTLNISTYGWIDSRGRFA